MSQVQSARRQMRAVVLEHPGGPEGLRLDRRPVPEPEADELLVRVRACGVCGHDLLARQGRLAAGPGTVLGHEIAGSVEALGAGADPSWLGRRVALVQRRPCGRCEQCRGGHTNACRSGPGFYGEDVPGGYGEYVLASPLNTVPLPDAIDDATGAILSCAVGTGLHALRRAELSPGDVVAVTGSTGGVGLHTVQLAAARGLHVVALTRQNGARDDLLAAGADEVVLVEEGTAGVRAAAARLGRPAGADAVVDTAGTPTFQLSLRSLAPRGRLVVVGNTEPGAVELGLGLVILKELVVLGSAHADRDELAEVVELVAASTIRPVVGQRWPLEAAVEAHAAVEAGAVTGRAVLVS